MELLPNAEWIIVLIVAIVGLIRYKKLSQPFKILEWSMIAVFVLDIVSKVVSAKYKTNAPVLQILCITEFVFYTVIYYYLFKNKLTKQIVISTIITISICFLINALFFQPFYKEFPTNLNMPVQILFAVFALLLFKEMLMYPVKVNIIKQSIFWFNTAMLFYGTTMFFFLGLSNYLSTRNLNDDFIFNFWYLIVDIFHILLCIAILTEDKKTIADAR